jgi:hypothetical protein
MGLESKEEIYNSKSHGGPISIKKFLKIWPSGWSNLGLSLGFFPFSQKDTKKRLSKGL